MLFKLSPVIACMVAVLASVSLGQITSRISFHGQAAPDVANATWSFYDSVGLNNQGQVLINGWARVQPPGGSAVNKSGLWTGTAGNLTKVAFSEPGLTETAEFLTFRDQVINDQGQIAFWVQNNHTVWRWDDGQRQRIAAPNDLLPGMPSGNRLLNIHNLAFNNEGRLAVKAYTWYSDDVSVGQWNNEGIWQHDGTQLSLVSREEGVAPELGASFRFRLTASAPRVSNDGVITFYDQLAGPYITWPSVQDNRDGNWSLAPGQSLRPVAVEGLAKPGGTPGEVWDTLSRSSSASGGVHALVAWQPDITRSGLFRLSGNFVQRLASSRTQVTGRQNGVWFGSFGSVYINAATDVAFTSFLTNADPLATTPINSTNNRGVFLARAGETTPRQIAAAGEHAPGTPSGVTFSVFDRAYLDDPGKLTLNSRGQIAFLTLLSGDGVTSGNNLALYLTDTVDQLHLIARTGDAFAFDPTDPSVTRIIKDIKVTLGSAGDDGTLRSLNDAGVLAYILTFTDNSTGVYTTSVPEPAAATVLLAGLSLLRRHRRCRTG